MKSNMLWLMIALLVIASSWCTPSHAGLLDGIWDVDVPLDIVNELELPKPKVKLNKVQAVYDDYYDEVNGNLKRLERNIRQANANYSGAATLVNTFTDSGIEAITVYFPGGGIVATLALAVGAWIAPPPRPFKNKTPPSVDSEP